MAKHWSEILSCSCGMRFRSMSAEAFHRHNFPILCKGGVMDMTRKISNVSVVQAHGTDWFRVRWIDQDGNRRHVNCDAELKPHEDRFGRSTCYKNPPEGAIGEADFPTRRLDLKSRACMSQFEAAMVIVKRDGLLSAAKLEAAKAEQARLAKAAEEYREACMAKNYQLYGPELVAMLRELLTAASGTIPQSQEQRARALIEKTEKIEE